MARSRASCTAAGYPGSHAPSHPATGTASASLAAANGAALPEAPDRRAFGAVVHQWRAADADRFAVLQPLVARMVGGTDDLVLEGEEAPPHYGLALDGYTRATAPIRRYADLLAQRLLKAALAGHRTPYTVDQLDDLVEHCRERGRAAETSSAKW